MEKQHIEQNLTGIHHGGLTEQQKDLFCTGLTRHFTRQEEEASVEKRIKNVLKNWPCDYMMFGSVKCAKQIDFPHCK